MVSIYHMGRFPLLDRLYFHHRNTGRCDRSSVGKMTEEKEMGGQIKIFEGSTLHKFIKEAIEKETGVRLTGIFRMEISFMGTRDKCKDFCEKAIQ